jgi:hypothetical protein
MDTLALVTASRWLVVIVGFIVFLWVVARGVRTWDQRNTEEHLLVAFLTTGSFSMLLACAESLATKTEVISARPVFFLVALLFLLRFMWRSRGKRIHVYTDQTG